VTGANSGIGEGIAREAAAQGAKVVINWVAHPEATDKIVSDITAAGGTAVGFQADVGKVDRSASSSSSRSAPTAGWT